MSELVCGVGYNDRKYPAFVDMKIVREYNIWRHMLDRCYSEKSRGKCPSYKGCSVSENFKSYTYFYDWCNSQIGFNNKGWHLDKDILVKGNKVYSEDVCVFVPRDLNVLLTKRDALRGEFPIGVSYCARDNLFAARCRIGSKEVRLGSFRCPIKAFEVYKPFKEAYIKEQAELYKGRVDTRVYEALMSYEVCIDD